MSAAPIIRAETPDDHAAIARVNDAAFGGADESALIARLRDQGLVAHSLVATRDDRVIGHILMSALPTIVDGRDIRALALAPVAVTPGDQRRGVGAALIRAAIAAARADNWQAIIVLGHPAYYPRFGFSAALAAKLQSPFSGPAFMALELQNGALAGSRGQVKYPAAFGVEGAPEH